MAIDSFGNIFIEKLSSIILLRDSYLKETLSKIISPFLSGSLSVKFSYVKPGFSIFSDKFSTCCYLII
jgi:hypothetical protein